MRIDNAHCYCQSEEYRDYVDLDYWFRLRKSISNNQILFTLKQDLDKFIAKIARKYHSPIESFMEWKTLYIEKIKSRLKRLKHDFGRGIFINKQFTKDIKKLKNRFIITVVDKAANKFCIICKYFYKDLLLKEYKNKVTCNIIKNGNTELDKRFLAFQRDDFQFKVIKL